MHWLWLTGCSRDSKVILRVEQMSQQVQNNSPKKGCGRMVSRRKLNCSQQPGTSENTKPQRKPRKKLAQRKKVKRPKIRGKYKARKVAPDEGLPAVGVRGADLVECIFSGDEERQELVSLTNSPTPAVALSDNVEYNTEEMIDFVKNFPTINAVTVKSQLELPRLDGSSTSDNTIFSSEDQGIEEELVSSVSAYSESTEPSASQSAVPESNHHSIETDFAPPTPVILKAVDKLKGILPPPWMPVGGKRGLHLYRFSSKQIPSAIQREIFLPYDGHAKVFVHCKSVSLEADLLKSVKLNDDNCIDKFCNWGLNLARTLEQYAVCIGADILELKEVWYNFSNVHIDKNPYQEEKYSETCRSNSCSLLIQLGKGKRCTSCGKLLRSFRLRRLFLLSKTPHASTPNTNLTHKQALEKLKIQQDKIMELEKKVAYRDNARISGIKE